MTKQASLQKILGKIDVKINGTRPSDVTIHDDRAYDILASGGSLAIGEAYMGKIWDCEDLAELVSRLHAADIYNEIVSFDHWPLIIRGIFSNLQSRARSLTVGREHYDLSDDLYTAMLGKTMSYTCGMWQQGVTTLDESQDLKHEWLCKKAVLKAGDRILDIGCGWGSLMKYAVEKYGVTAVGLSISEGQTALGRKLCAGLPIDFVISDYRDYKDEKGFDHIFSLEMIEHVGPKNLSEYFSQVNTLLKPGGKFLLQNIVSHDAVPKPDRWIDKYIFPNGVLPSLPQLERASRKDFNIEHVEDIGPDYDLTLMAWWDNFNAAYPELKANNPQYNERFYRMWKFYLQSCAGLFRSRTIHDWQMVFGKR